MKDRSNVARARGMRRMSVAAAAVKLGCSESWVYKLIAAGELSAVRVGNQRGMQVTLRSVAAYIRRRDVQKKQGEEWQPLQ